MVQPEVRKAVTTRFNDEAISVRDAAISLVGSFVIKQSAVANAFHKALLEKLSDPGVSVRKRAVKIFRDLLVTNPSYEGRATALGILVKMAADRKEDDGVRDLIHETFEMLWFESRPSSASALTVSHTTHLLSATVTPDASEEMAFLQDSDSTPPILTKNGRRRISRKKGAASSGKDGDGDSSAAARQMVEVVAWLGSSDFLTKVVKELLFGLSEIDKDKKAAERRKRRTAAQGRCNRIVAALIEYLLQFEEGRGNLDKNHAGRHLAAIVCTIGVFADAYPSLLVQHLDVLLPYLKADNGLRKEDEAVIVSCVSHILGRIAPMLTAVHIRRVCEGAVIDDLIRVTYNFGSNAVSAAVEALAMLASHKDAGSDHKDKLLQLAGTFFGFLYKTRSATVSKVPLSVKGNIQRALSALGSICRFQMDLWEEDDTIVDDDLLELIDPQETELTWSNLSGACYVMFFLFFQKDDVPTKCQSVRAMSGIFLSRPRIMLRVEQTGIISELISEESHISIRLEALQCWRAILLAEEQRVESGEAQAKMDNNETITLSKKISGDQDGDSCLIGGVLSQHYLRFYEMVTSQGEISFVGCIILCSSGVMSLFPFLPHLLM